MLTPRDLAFAYDRWLAARWRGEDDEARPFGDWIESFWCAEAPSEPRTGPDAVSVLGGAGRGIRWYADGAVIRGYVVGRPRGCYLVPAATVPPADVSRLAFEIEVMPHVHEAAVAAGTW
jgi:hypothetical protein